MIFKRIKPAFLRYLLYIFGSGALIIFLFILSIYIGAWGKLPNKDQLTDFKYQKASEVFSADSVLIGKYYLYDRQPIAFSQMPDHLIKALVAIEDERFYEHSGVDYRSLARVTIKTVLLQDQKSGGGSTISQQLAKNLYPRENKGKLGLVVSKIKEMFIAKRLESAFTKEEVLQHYLNTVSFGDNTFGVESAALKFFSTQANNLKIEEAAVLIGMLKATYSYNPRVFPATSLNRRNLVLRSMYLNGYLEKRLKDSLIALPLNLKYKAYDYNEGIAPYFREEVRKQLLKWNKTRKEEQQYNIYTSGLKIYTTLNYKMQHLAEEVMKRHMSNLQQRFEVSYGNNGPWNTDKQLIDKAVRSSSAYKKLIANGLNHKQAWDSLSYKKTITLSSWAGDKIVEGSTIDSIQHYLKFLNTGSLSLDPKSGAVQTWIGGINFKRFKYDHVAQSRRQVGSTFKPILYTAALEAGISPCTYFSAREVAYKNLEDWSPGNSSKKDEVFLNYSMEEALSNSVNTVAVKLLEQTGIEPVLKQAKAMGIISEQPKLPSLALGTGEIYVNELAGAYTSFLNDGKAVRPYVIQTITDQNDSILGNFSPKMAQNSAFSIKNGQIMLEMMKSTINSGTASRIRATYKLNNEIAGKTGTTQDNKDAWFVALTPKLVHVSWVGLDNHEIGFRSTALGQGANAALPLFALFMQELNKDSEFNHITRAKFPQPNDEVFDLLDCEPVKRDGFFKRLFSNPKKKKTRKFRS
ncbi:transglycosylase domain-containing protein [Muriicola sp. Z0-33]|uniref:transglycosylase domain-containing protein n=1 Tax=Muriicola sp. Z0-33 TaxID=2816957 RepID=UPI0022380AD8|nr:transglycosylase domain-containing protein [Muriicola sp. Z0-33]MCW5517400.1 transglycosylase domain-containing protein [Muriicola sp. Z0-33]